MSVTTSNSSDVVSWHLRQSYSVMACNLTAKKLAVRREEEAQTETRIQAASNAMANGTFKHLSQATHHFNAPYGTLRR